MKILQRYVLRELILPFVLCLLVLNFIFMAGYMVRAADFIIGSGVPLLDSFWVLILALPEMMSYTVPTSLLTAILIVFGNFSQNNEIRAMKASGVHPLVIMGPAFIVGLALSFGMLMFNDQVMGNASFELRRTTKKMMIKHPHALIEPGRFVKFDDNIIFLTKELNGNKLKDVVVYEVEDSEEPVRTIIAEHGEIISASKDTQMKIRLYNGSISDAENKGVQSIQFKTYEFSTLGESDIRKMQKKMRDLTLAELLARVSDKNLSKKDLKKLWAAFHNRIAFAFGSFIFIFIGIPIAILVRRGEIVLSFAIAMTIACLYYILFVGAKTVTLQGLMPPLIAFWIPNVVLIALGCHLLRRSFIY